jgi:DNA repair protein RadD
MTILRPYQDSALSNIFSAIAAGFRRIMVESPTGTGKTELAAASFNQLKEVDRGLFIVPTIGLVDQTVEKFRARGILDIGVIQAQHPLTNPRARIQIASIDTLRRRDMPPAKLVIIDEAHRWYRFYAEWMAWPEWADVPFVGLSATPWTRGLGKHYHKLIRAIRIQDAINQGYLTPFRAFAPSRPDLSRVRIVAGDYHEGDLAGVMNRTTLVGDCVNSWLARGEGRATLCFGVDCAHAAHLQETFAAAGVPTAYIDADTGLAEREDIKQEFHAGIIKVVCNVGCLILGVDWDVRCIIMARPTQSEILFTQCIGRGLRPAEGKKDLLILDHSSNHARLGFVTDIHHEELDDGEMKPNRSRQNLPNECGMCGFIKSRDVRICPSCGFAPPPRPLPYCVAGNLEEIKPLSPDEKKTRFYQELKAYAAARGHKPDGGYRKPGWPSCNFKDRFGHWPDDNWRFLPGIEPSPETSRWAREKVKAYWRSKEVSL